MLTPDERANAYAQQLGRNAATIRDLLSMLSDNLFPHEFDSSEQVRLERARAEANLTLDEIESAYERNQALAARIRATYQSALREPEQFNGMKHSQAAALRPTIPLD